MTRAAPIADEHPDRLVLDDLVFSLRRSTRRRTVGITVDRDGSLILHVPADTDPATVRRWASGKRGWVYRKLAEKDLLLAPPVTKDFVSGEGFDYLGRRYRLRVTDEVEKVKLERGRLLLPRNLAGGDGAARAVIGWYRYRALNRLPAHVRALSRRMHTPVDRLDVQDLGYRWGSLGGGTRLNLHWATMQLPPSLVDYVIVHELAHVSEPNHTPRFWEIVARTMPDYETRKQRLAHLGSQLWLG
ncbi:M48 family metallopeptidase [Haloactinomyces albus]|uniref:Metal-dependent hydrolase n=1 Tax=Haloactinomyces albus TaxID=1352928 RepID=A0AAE3ZC65_9ACTN|nr:SprT family zinc-dependent metalloprotease [Haloactinomyces albus]MDR7300991.1 putative metal-dependent hydrolase [Haloactinomyces albus]